jgi:acylphosphatase
LGGHKFTILKSKDMTRHLQMTVSGKVENTGFRLFALWGAKEFNISGEVRQKDGNVLIEAEGEEIAIHEFIEWCRKGPEGSVVEKIYSVEKIIVGYKDFMIL